MPEDNIKFCFLCWLVSKMGYTVTKTVVEETIENEDEVK